MAAWLLIFSCGQANGASAQAPGDTFRCPPRSKDSTNLANRVGVVPEVPRKLVAMSMASSFLGRSCLLPTRMSQSGFGHGRDGQPGRGVDADAGGAAEPGELDGQPGSTRHVEYTIADIDSEMMVCGGMYWRQLPGSFRSRSRRRFERQPSSTIFRPARRWTLLTSALLVELLAGWADVLVDVERVVGVVLRFDLG